jgi:hypothetical protein
LLVVAVEALAAEMELVEAAEVALQFSQLLLVVMIYSVVVVEKERKVALVQALQKIQIGHLLLAGLELMALAVVEVEVALALTVSLVQVHLAGAMVRLVLMLKMALLTLVVVVVVLAILAHQHLMVVLVVRVTAELLTGHRR